jgi:hypothetical protein
MAWQAAASTGAWLCDRVASFQHLSVSAFRLLLECRRSVPDNDFVIRRIRELLHSTPFQPFLVRTSDGREYSVPTSDHAAIHPRGSYVVIFSDRDSHTDVAGLHVASVVKKISI